MNFDEWIGLLITFGAFVYMVIRGAFHAQTPIEEVEEQVSLPPPLPKIKIKKRKARNSTSESPSIVSQHFKESASYEVFVTKTPSKASRLLQGLKSKKEMVILKEIMDPPKGLR